MEGICIFLLCLMISSTFAARKFPDSFQFGTAGAAYQFEGAWNEDGKGPSWWDTFAHTPGKIFTNETGDIACDSYHKYKEDVQILKNLGVKLYRFSISWPRILPDGIPTKINQPGVDYYLNLIKELKDNDIEPVVTLYHWDLPQHLGDLGGWLNPQIADYFAAYARIAFQYFGPYVKYWITLNEPGTTCNAGYEVGVYAPGLSLPGEGTYQCYYVHILAHAKAYRIYDEEFRATQGGKVTINVASSWFYAKTNSSADLAALERAIEFNCLQNQVTPKYINLKTHNTSKAAKEAVVLAKRKWICIDRKIQYSRRDSYNMYLKLGIHADPVFKGNWPPVVIDTVANRSKLEGYPFSRLPKFTQAEIALINGTYDYFTVNIYSSSIVENNPNATIGTPSYSLDQATITSVDPSWPPSASPWLYSVPDTARQVLNYVWNKYQPSEIIITENGWSDNGELDDQDRITFYKDYLNKILDAIDDGVNVTGYTLWSLLDNFEWAYGYSAKFGIVQVDFNSPNRTRTWKSSADWYKRVVAARELVD